MMQSLKNANIHFNQQGTPVATDFDDIYFSNDGGLAETEYVFLQQNGLPYRWQQTPDAFFHIIETGFGTGANFLLSWLQFRQFRQQQPEAACRKLYFSSFEKYPLSLSDLTTALQTHHELSELCQQLLTQYPPAIPGCHRLTFDNGDVVLDLWLGDVNELLPQLADNNQADAFFLDGFAPGKNPDMWQQSLFDQMARLSHARTTVATFTCAGLVKRGLQHSGFTIRKVKGFGRKREMLTATFNPAAAVIAADLRSGNSTATDKVCIIGGGIASVCLALQLVEKGITTELICEDNEIAQGASHNLQGAVYPNLHAAPTLASLLHCQAFYFAKNFYQRLADQGLPFAMQWCGVLHLATNADLEKRQQKIIAMANWPTELVYAVTPKQATRLAGVALNHSGIFLPQAGWLSPQQFCQAAVALLLRSRLFQVRLNCEVSAINAVTAGPVFADSAAHACSSDNPAEHKIQAAPLWRLQFDKNTSANTYACVVLANGADITRFAVSQHLPVNRVRGQVSHVSSSGMASINTVLCHKGYITPALDGCHAVGATFDRKASSAFVSEADDQENLDLVNSQLQQPEWFTDAEISGSRAAFRATVPDHLPLLGSVANCRGLYALGGLGARGILLAPLLAETLACQIAGRPLAMTTDYLKALDPERFNRAATKV